MNPQKANSIDEVLSVLDGIIDHCIRTEDALGFFAVLYRRVTLQVKKGIEAGYFDDGPRMEKLDIIFAQRYIDAYRAFRRGDNCTQSWTVCFDLAANQRPIVFQHLLAGINAHINLDLGIAAAAVSRGRPVRELKADFDRINLILASLVAEVQHNLSTIWPPLRWLLQRTGQLDNLLVDFSMELARDGAWRFAEALARREEDQLAALIAGRDEKVALKAALLDPERPRSLRWLLALIRLGERGSVSWKLQCLQTTLEQADHRPGSSAAGR